MKTGPAIIAIMASMFICAHQAPSRSEDDGRAVLAGYFPAVNGPGAVVEGPLSVEEIEKREMRNISKCDRCPQVPFGFINDSWIALKSKITAGDRIYFFRTNTASWMALMGRQGYALIRKNTTIDVILTEMN